jgi:uncharacterized membrane protein YdjX (TVP38/TMEM64 family)
MAKSKKIKLFIGLFYISAVGLFLYFIFTKFSFQELSSYEFIKNNRDYFFELKRKNLLILSLIFVIVTALWVFLAGFLLPFAILSGFIFGKWIGLILIVFGGAIGATSLYIFANYFLKNMIKEKFLSKYQILALRFKQSELLYMMLYRFIGGIPFVISNVLPCIFNVRILNFFIATLVGITPQIFLITSIGSGLEKIIEKNSMPPKILDIIFTEEIYVPILGFVILIFITIIMKNLFYKNE